ncbi:ABC transporter permease [Gordonia soli]|uniref:Putative ABC transporter permease protein n=1 Tax=Gordonia soli NBRC 108243 TaxID=1223545 RepID=M0QCW6_9ACTN|nr:iron ABC transporter permease [Gordonia soli]GAC66448.1 putative ABC transporter permease protein [Gordonia soli NBRC 108243]
MTVATRLGRWAVVAVPVVFVAVLFGWPLVTLVRRAVDTGSDVGLAELLSRTNAVALLGVTLGQAALSTVAAVVVAIPIVWVVARVEFPGAGILLVLVTVPFVLPTVVVGIAFRALLDGPLGFTGIGSGLWAIVAAHVFLNVAVVVRVVSAAWRSLDPRVEEAARTLGASRFRAFAGVVAPRLLPAVGAASALVFLFCSTSFGVVVILGNGVVRTLETEIYTQAIGYFRIPEAVALSMLQIVVVIAALVLTRFFGDPVADRTPGRLGARRRPRGWGWMPVAGAVAWIAVVLVGPIAVLVVRSVRPRVGGAWTLDGYRSLGTSVNGVSPLETLGYSVGTAAAAMAIALLIGVPAAVGLHRARGAAGAVGDVVAMVPLGISAVTLGFGYLLLLATMPTDVAASPLVIPCVQALIAIPVVVRILVPALRSVSPRLRDAAAALGASPRRVFMTVDLPLIGRSLTAAGGFAFVMALGEFGATSFLARADTTTLPVLIGSALNRPGADNLATAMAASTLLVIATALAIAVVEIFRPRSGGLI